MFLESRLGNLLKGRLPSTSLHGDWFPKDVRTRTRPESGKQPVARTLACACVSILHCITFSNHSKYYGAVVVVAAVYFTWVLKTVNRVTMFVVYVAVVTT